MALLLCQESKFSAHGLRQQSHAKLAPAVAPTLPPLPLSTAGRHIVDASGRRLKLRCVSWSGGQEAWFAPSGLWAQHQRVIAGLAASGGFNCVRLVVSLEMVLGCKNGSAVVPSQALAANQDLHGATPLQVLDAVIAAVIKQVRRGAAAT